MRLAVTGGGTGGHVFPALEAAREARDLEWQVVYFGSLRGQEGAVCGSQGIAFEGFPSEPLYSVRTPRGWRASVRILRSAVLAKRRLRAFSPDALLSTGGYSSAPVVTAARSLGIPYVVHEQNSVPGRTNRMAARRAFCVATTFRAAEAEFPGSRVERTGLPVRRELRAAAASPRRPEGAGVLVVGGSQGAGPLNAAAVRAAALSPHGPAWMHVSGPTLFDSVRRDVEAAGLAKTYRIAPYLDAAEMALAYREAGVVVARGGAGTLAELAAFRLPAVVIPFPQAFANHQLHNANEFAEMGAATVLPQSDLGPEALQAAASAWLGDPGRRDAAGEALAAWDAPAAAGRLLELLAASAGVGL